MAAMAAMNARIHDPYRQVGYGFRPLPPAYGADDTYWSGAAYLENPEILLRFV